jgi:putative DNA primase/helicase
MEQIKSSMKIREEITKEILDIGLSVLTDDYSQMIEIFEKRYNGSASTHFIKEIFDEMLMLEYRKQLVQMFDGNPIPHAMIATILSKQFTNNKLIYSSELRWLSWNGKYWAQTENIKTKIADLLLSVFNKKELSDKIIRKTQTGNILNSIETLLREKSTIKIEDLDSNPWLLNFSNGTLDLRTGILTPHDPSQLITKIVNHNYNPLAESPKFIKFIEDVLSPEQIPLMQEALGYALCGSNREEVCFFLIGNGANGKSTLLNTIMSILGTDYAKTTPSSTLLNSRSENTNDIAALRGIRTVTAVESDGDRYLNSARVKKLTSTDPISARFLFGEFFTFSPSFKIFFAMNNLPTINSSDNGIWRRIILFNFERTFVGTEINTHLSDDLKEEAEGIIGWMFKGFERWYNEELKMAERMPASMTLNKNDYQDNSNNLSAFIEECCFTKDPDVTFVLSTFMSLYKTWCRSQGLSEPKLQRVTEELKRLGFKKKNTGTKRVWLGLSMKLEAEEALRSGKPIKDEEQPF